MLSKRYRLFVINYIYYQKFYMYQIIINYVQAWFRNIHVSISLHIVCKHDQVYITF
jgi:hypothetical protein